ncbi:MAG: hypothetical protein IPJ88_06155 [Myxococcales bacterium]|nr:MAG: hypothetical protein IPJ88_06155 [Myxococcales bacterium]
MALFQKKDVEEDESSSLLMEGQSLASKLKQLLEFADVLSGLWIVAEDNAQIRGVLGKASSLLADFSFEQEEIKVEQTFAEVASLLEDAELKIARVLNCMQLSQLTEALDDGVLDYPEVLRLRQLASASPTVLQTRETSAMINPMAVTSASLEWQRKQNRTQVGKTKARLPKKTKSKKYSSMRAALTVGLILSLGYGTYTAWHFYQVRSSDFSEFSPLDIYEISPLLLSGSFAGRANQRDFVGELDLPKWSALTEKDKEELLLHIWDELEGNKGFQSVILLADHSMVAHLSNGKVRFVR